MALVSQAWLETCFITLSELGGSTNYDLRAVTQDVTMDDGAKPITSEQLLTGGRIILYEAEEDSKVTLSGYTVTAGDYDATTPYGLDMFFHSGNVAAEPLRVENSHTRDLWRVVLLWTNYGAATTAHGATTPNTDSYRKVYANGTMTDLGYEFTGNPKVLKMTAEFTFPPFSRLGYPNLMRESGNQTKLDALHTYNTTNYGEAASSRTW